MQGRITKRTVDALKAGESIADNEQQGFQARRLPSGLVTYVYRYRNAAGVRQIISLGTKLTPDQARAKADKHADEIERGKDPAANETRRRNTTVDAVLDNYIERDVKPRGLRSLKGITGAFDRHVRPDIGTMSIYDLRRSHIGDMLDEIEDNAGPVMADRTLAYLRRAFNWQATRDDDFQPPIVKGMTKTKPGERRRKRILTDQEIADVLTAVDQLGGDDAVPDCYPKFIRALLTCALRRNEVARCHRKEIDGRNWIVPADRMKNKLDHLVPITPALAKLFGNRDGFLFSNDEGATAISGFSKPKAALDAKIAELRKAAAGKPMPHWTLHDLRRTARSLMSRYATPDIAERVIGHVIPGVRGVYDLYEYADEKRSALESLAGHLSGIARPPAARPAASERRRRRGRGGASDVERRLDSSIHKSRSLVS